jgi:transcriptional regulator with XRE-family HTH domain
MGRLLYPQCDLHTGVSLYMNASMNMSNQHGQMVKSRREQVGLTQREFARLVHLALVTIQKIESGERNIAPANMASFCSALNLTSQEEADLRRVWAEDRAEQRRARKHRAHANSKPDPPSGDGSVSPDGPT